MGCLLRVKMVGQTSFHFPDGQGKTALHCKWGDWLKELLTTGNGGATGVTSRPIESLHSLFHNPRLQRFILWCGKIDQHNLLKKWRQMNEIIV
jgi:hypothetical protein